MHLYLYNKQLSNSHSTASGCLVADADIEIVGPTMEDMFLNNKGKIVCRVQENSPSVGQIWWEDQDGNEMVSSSGKLVHGRTTSLSLDISYDEWSRGLQRYCIVEHSAWIEPAKKLYERNIGKKTTEHLKKIHDDHRSCMYLMQIFSAVGLYTVV